jgi:ABC-type transporter Mla subunit MlaD
MNTPPESAELEEITRFLHRFADLMSNGSNSENLLRAAKLLEANVKRAGEAENLLRQEKANCANLENRMADLKAQLATIQGALSEGSHVIVPVSILRLAASQFESLAAAFEKSGNVVSQAMCEASASTLHRVFEADAPRTSPAIARGAR